MSKPDFVSQLDWNKILYYSNVYKVNPNLIAAIGWHETHWGKLGAGRTGWILGYGYFPGSTVQDYYKGLDRQLQGAMSQINRDFKGSINLSNITNFAVGSWKSSAPGAWAKSVWNIYQQLPDYVPGVTVSPDVTIPKSILVESNMEGFGSGKLIDVDKGLLENIAGKLEQCLTIIKDWIKGV